MIIENIEQKICAEYVSRATAEISIEKWINILNYPISLIVVEGFEERSLGIADKLADKKANVSSLVIGRYSDNLELNEKYRDRFEMLSKALSANRHQIIDCDSKGQWIVEALKFIDTEAVVIDITGLPNIGIFRALDAAVISGRKIFIGYSEPIIYWPKKENWESLNKKLDKYTTLVRLADEAQWLFGYEHRVELVECHEGYDSAGHGHALIGFLPFKSARLGAIIEREIYSELIFIAGRPRLDENKWRLDALKKINASLIKEWQSVEMSTFSYLAATAKLAEILFSEPFHLLHKYDVHLAIIGSKIQTIACWIISSIVKSITVVASLPDTYYPQSFSEGIGVSWIIELTSPYDINHEE